MTQQYELVPTDDEIRKVAEKHYGTCMTAQELSFARAILAQFTQPSPAESDHEAVRNAALEDVLEWLETEVSAIDLWYRGDPSYEHDACYIRDQVMRLLSEAKATFKEDQSTKTNASVGTIAHVDHGKITLTAAVAAMVLKPAQPSDTALLQNALTAILWLERRLQPGYRKDQIEFVGEIIGRIETAMKAQDQS